MLPASSGPEAQQASPLATFISPSEMLLMKEVPLPTS